MIILLLYAVLQAITEFFPVSSSAHILLLSDLIKKDDVLSLEIALHTGTGISLLIYYRKKIIELLKNPSYRTYSIFLYSLIPTVLIGLIFTKYFQENLYQSGLLRLVIVLGLTLGTILLYSASKDNSTGKDWTKNTPKDSLAIGFFQSLALLPGVSRSGATIAASKLRGQNLKSSLEYSFLLAIPITIGGGLGVKLSSSQQLNINNEFYVLVLTTAVLGVISLHVINKLVSKYNLLPFIYYRILLIIVLVGSLIANY